MTTDTTQEIQDIIGRYDERSMALLPVLRHLQDRDGHIDPGLRMLIADIFNITQAELKGVISFYHDFTDTRPSSPRVRLCRAEACQANGSEALAAEAEKLTAGSDESVGAVYCLGLCASGPAAEVDGKPVARLTTEKLGRLLAGETS